MNYNLLKDGAGYYYKKHVVEFQYFGRRRAVPYALTFTNAKSFTSVVCLNICIKRESFIILVLKENFAFIHR